MKDEEFILIRDAIEEILTYLRLNHKNENPFAIRRKKLEIHRHSPLNLSISEKEECDLLFSYIPYKIKIWEVISRELPMSKKCINALIQDDIFGYGPFDDMPKPYPYQEEIYQSAYGQTLGQFLKNYLDVEKSFDFNEEVLSEIYQYFNFLRQRKVVTEYAFIPLYGYSMTNERLDISDNLYIERITDEDIQYIFSFKNMNYTVQENRDRATLAKLEFKLCGTFTYEKDKELGVETSKFQKSLADFKFQLKTAIVSLRLAYDGKISPFSIFYRECPISKYHFSNIYHLRYLQSDFEYYPYPITFYHYELNDEVKTKFLEIYQILSNSELRNNLKPLRIGLEKFNQSFSRLTWEDMILDYVTVLDSTLLYNNKTSNFYQLSARCSLLIADKLGYNIFKFTQELSSIRNEIIHNGKRIEDLFKDDKRRIDNKDCSIYEFIETARTLVRSVLTEYIFRIDSEGGIGTINKNMEEAYFIQNSKASSKKS